MHFNDNHQIILLFKKKILSRQKKSVFIRNKIRLLLNCAPVRPGTPLCAPVRPVLKNIRKSYNLMFKGSFTL